MSATRTVLPVPPVTVRGNPSPAEVAAALAAVLAAASGPAGESPYRRWRAARRAALRDAAHDRARSGAPGTPW